MSPVADLIEEERTQHKDQAVIVQTAMFSCTTEASNIYMTSLNVCWLVFNWEIQLEYHQNIGWD